MPEIYSAPSVINPYVFWRHPVARVVSVTLLILLDICVYGTDPVNDSRVENSVPGVGNIYSFLFCLPSGGRLLSRLGLMLLCTAIGIYIGRMWLHHRFLRDICGLSMFAENNGSFFAMGLGVAGAYLGGGAVYNWMIPADAERVTRDTNMEARSFGKLLQCCSAAAHAVSAVQVVDGVLQDRQRYPNWACNLKYQWRQSFGGWLRVLCGWVAAVALAGICLLSTFAATATWGGLDEIARVFFASCLMFLDLFAVVQDWEFPTFQAPSGLEREIMIAGTFKPSFHCGVGSCLTRCAQSRRSELPSPASSPSILQHGVEQFFNLTFTGPWLTYGPLLCAVCLDLLGTCSQLLYHPEDWGQYVDPKTNRIWTITDKHHLSAYRAGALERPDLVSWATRRNASTGLPLANAATDVLTSASWSGALMVWKVLAAAPGFLMLIAFWPLVFVGECLGRRPDGRPPLQQALPDPEALQEGLSPKLKPCKWISKDELAPPLSPSSCMTPSGLACTTPPGFDAKPNGITWEPSIVSMPSLREPPIVASAVMEGSREMSSAPLPPVTVAEERELDWSRISWEEDLHVQAKARQAAMDSLQSQVGHFDVLLRRSGKSLGVTFKLPELGVRTMKRVTLVQKAMLQGLQLTVPEGGDLVNFGRYSDMTMRDLADRFPGYCSWALQQERESTDPSPHLLKFAMYLRMVRPEFKDELVERAESKEAHDAKEAQTLLVVDIVEGSVMDDYNKAQAAVGAWDRVVLPGMFISSVNGIRRDPLAMANSLCKSEVLTVRFVFIRGAEGYDDWQQAEEMQVNDKTQRLLEERVSKLVRMEGLQIVDSMRSQADWEAMASNLASALVKEVYRGDRCLHPPGICPPPPLQDPAWLLQDSPDRMMVSMPAVPAGLPPVLPLRPSSAQRRPSSAATSVVATIPELEGLTSMDELSESEESV